MAPKGTHFTTSGVAETSRGSFRVKRPDPKRHSSSSLCNVVNASDFSRTQDSKDSEGKQTPRTSEESLVSQFVAIEEAVKKLIEQLKRLEANEVHDQLKKDLEYELQYNLVGIRTSGVLQELTEPHEIDGLRGALRDRRTALEGISSRLGKLPRDPQKEKERAKKEIINAIRDILTKPMEIANEIKEKLDKQNV